MVWYCRLMIVNVHKCQEPQNIFLRLSISIKWCPFLHTIVYEGLESENKTEVLDERNQQYMIICNLFFPRFTHISVIVLSAIDIVPETKCFPEKVIFGIQGDTYFPWPLLSLILQSVQLRY